MSTPSAGVPLARLLLMAGRSMVDDLHVRLQEEGWDGIRPAFGFVLVALKDRDLTTSALADELAVTKQAASKLAEAMVAADLVSRETDPADARNRILALTPTGRRLLVDVERIYVELEAAWAEVIGERPLRQTAKRLSDILLAVHGGRLPPVRP